jgi:hypothetical protein
MNTPINHPRSASLEIKTLEHPELETAKLEMSELEITVRWSQHSTTKPYTARVTGPRPQYILEFGNPQALLQHLEWLIRPRPGLR